MSESKDRYPGWVWLLLGLVVGVFFATSRYADNSSNKQTSVRYSYENEPQRYKEDLDFYRSLEEHELKVSPISEYRSTPKQAVRPQPSLRPNTYAVNPGEYYLLQAGSFRQREDAERLRASLLLTGLQASVSEVNLSSGRWHRVNVGPYYQTADLQSAISILDSVNVRPLVMKRN